MSADLKADLESLRINRESAPAARHGSGKALRAIGWLLFVAALAGGGVMLYPRFEAQVFKTEVSVGEVATISPSQASTSVTATGYVEPQVISRVAPKTVGRLSRVLVREGDTVTQGQVIFELEHADNDAAIAAARARAASAEARVAAARANVAEVEVQLLRQQSLVASGAAARQVTDDLISRKDALNALVNTAAAEVRAANADIEVQRIAMSQLVIHAPIAGTVITKPPEVGDAVSPGTPLVEIVDMTSLMVEVDVPEARLPLVRPDSPAEIVLDAFATKRFRGATAEIGHRVNRSKATLVVKVRFVDPSDGVLPDMSARVSFLTAALTQEELRAQEKVVIPEAAVVTRHGERVVFVIEEDVVHERRVQVGAAVGHDLELLRGPDPGAHVVLHPPTTLGDGQKVKEKSES